jgi:proteasome assembly chaperone (PAC2) family protein
MPHLSLMGQAPHYLQRAENPAVMQALLRYVSRLLDLELDVSQFDEVVKVFRAQCDEAVAHNTSVQTHIRQLEQAYDATIDEASRSLHDEDLNPDQLMQELEDFLREEREGGNMG